MSLLESYKPDFHIPKGENTRVTSLSVGLQQYGPLSAAPSYGLLQPALDAGSGVMVCSPVSCIGATIQTINSHQLGPLYVDRVIAGLEVGGASVLCTSILLRDEPQGTP